jgi:hypothetical protein
MKKFDMELFLSQELDAYITLDNGYQEGVPGGKLLLERIMALGMVPPEVKVLTPLGAFIYFTTREWEEDLNYDDCGYEKGHVYDEDDET